MKKTLSIIIPAYNAEKTVSNAVESIIKAKNINAIEVIIINDGSKDNTKIICDGIIEAYKEKILIRKVDQENKGHGSSINYAIQKASGTYFSILDSDDIYKTDALGELVEKLKSSKSDVVFCDYEENRNGVRKKCEWGENIANDINNGKFDKDILEKVSWDVLPMAFVKTSVLRKAKVLVEEGCYYEDQEFDYLVYEFCNSFSYYKNTVYVYNLGQTTQSVSMNGFIKNSRDHSKVIMWLLDKYSNEKKEYIKNKLQNVIIRLSNLQYQILLQWKKNKKEFLEFDNKLKKYPYFYNNKKIAGRKTKVHRLTKGIILR